MFKILHLFFVICLSTISLNAAAQLVNKDTIDKIPTIKVWKMDSTKATFTSEFVKGKANILIFFSPDCDHCQDEIKAIRNKIDSFKNVQFILISNRSISEIKKFAREYKISNVKNIKLVSDDANALIRHYGIAGFPSMIIYNKNKRIVGKYISSTVSIGEMLRKVKE